MSVTVCNEFLTNLKLFLNKTELENLFDHFGSSPSKCGHPKLIVQLILTPSHQLWTRCRVDMAAFFSAVLEDNGGEDPVMWISADPPKNPNTAHLALSGISHIEFGVQFKPFPKHWGAPPNAQLKGHNGIMRALPGGYGKVKFTRTYNTMPSSLNFPFSPNFRETLRWLPG